MEGSNYIQEPVTKVERTSSGLRGLIRHRFQGADFEFYVKRVGPCKWALLSGRIDGKKQALKGIFGMKPEYIGALEEAYQRDVVHSPH